LKKIMTPQPLIAAFLGGWELALVLALLGIVGLAVVAGLVVVAVLLLKKRPAHNVPSPAILAENQPPLLRT
jgi:hypothetical protein